jgi:hypothetical protein
MQIHTLIVVSPITMTTPLHLVESVMWGKQYSRRPVKKGAASKEHAAQP